jgi:dimethylglycine dehydrogenase
VRRDKPDFLGKAAVLRAGPAAWRCVALALDDAADADCHGGEAVLHHGRVVGAVSSGAWGPAVERSLAFATVEAAAAAPGTALAVTVLGMQRVARVLAEAPYDPAGHRLRG